MGRAFTEPEVRQWDGDGALFAVARVRDPDDEFAATEWWTDEGWRSHPIGQSTVVTFASKRQVRCWVDGWRAGVEDTQDRAVVRFI